MPCLPWWFAPLIHSGIARFWHYTSYYIIPPGVDILIRWAPEDPSKVWHTFAMTFGLPRNIATGEVVYTDEMWFEHRGKEMIWHWDPLVESIVLFDYPHDVTATKEEPIELRFVNETTDKTIKIDVSIWLFEYDKSQAELVKKYMRGVLNFFLEKG